MTAVLMQSVTLSAPGTPAVVSEKRSQRLALEQAYGGPPFVVPGGSWLGN